MLFLLIRRDLVSQYKQTVLGPLWLIAQPLFGTGIFAGPSMVIQLSVASVFILPIWYAWVGAAAHMIKPNAIQSNAGLFGKVYFPR